MYLLYQQRIDQIPKSMLVSTFERNNLFLSQCVLISLRYNSKPFFILSAEIRGGEQKIRNDREKSNIRVDEEFVCCSENHFY